MSYFNNYICSDLGNFIPVQKGRVAKDQMGRFVLINPKQKAYSTSQEILAIWELCDGKLSVNSICEQVEKIPYLNGSAVPYVIENLRDANLVKFI